MGDDAHPQEAEEAAPALRFSDHPIARFRQKKALAHFAGKWRDCMWMRCRQRKRCTGGPRGQCRRSGTPLCETAEAAFWPSAPTWR
ncbi:hypothetical protein [Salaquimonas pukyongi]|uniref:hypothetical protein n=1 Tax=Salaquimonas pukyongi TaxID=2712698 RepID=UPI0012ECB9D3|nr:hypothetical protein [Salaquimonas pukyongi]